MTIASPAMAKRVALYLRVSTHDQNCEMQRRELLSVAEKHGWAIAAEYRDEGISGAKHWLKRPAYRAMLKGMVRRDFDMVAAWSIDRLSRSLIDLIAFLGELHAAKVDLYLHQQAIDTTTPAGKAMFQMMGVFAEFERAMIVERVKAGVARKRAETGGRWGRPKVLPRIERKVTELLQAGTGINKTARLAHCSNYVVQRIKREMMEAVNAGT